ncbi:substrate-binding domain-containing protein [Lacimicrobium sp. SS2-24]|uniref:substrate-binding domain-containing protein n=1 Tax=Lacimicrobium sp. SS2-24 TaxID=2005569 RepID=UPI001FEDF939|nr:substrate-binding domain-containing protein [Lacimicrobium sp. SS2-24]
MLAEQSGYTIAVVGKTKNDSFYEQSHQGCLAYAKGHKEVRCVYDGSLDYQDVRTQVLVINELLEEGFDGLLVSTTDSNYLVEGSLKALAEKNIPVITFDSDLLPEHQAYRLAYVGTNNLDFGKALGNAAKPYKTLHPQPICIQSGHRTTPNLNARIAGVRLALSGQSETRLDGRSGWIEHARCPVYNMGKRYDAVDQLITILGNEPPPIFIAVAGFAQFHPRYIETMSVFRPLIKRQKVVIISADTESIQLRALNRGLSTVNIGQRPYEMGRQATALMHRYLTTGKKPEQSHYYLDYHYCTEENAQTCTTSR